MTLRERIGASMRSVCAAVGTSETRRWPPHSRLFLLSDSPDWVLEGEVREIGAIARSFGIETPDRRLFKFAGRQCAFFTSNLSLLLARFPPPGAHRLATSYFHGRPGAGSRAFDAAFDRLRANHARLDRVQVTHDEMRQIVLSSGIDPAKVFLIRLAVNRDLFPQRTAETRRQARDRLSLPDDALVVGSLQKDGVGWGDGFEPKLEKGPDVFVKVVEALKATHPTLHVVLSGPARGYVKRSLDALGVPYRHEYPEYTELWRLYHALDAYLVTSRQEGGPKAVLEAMSCGVPLITTRVGQAADLVRHGLNGWLTDVGDVEDLAHWTSRVLSNAEPVDAVVAEGARTAEAHTYASQRPQWRAFFDGFIE